MKKLLAAMTVIMLLPTTTLASSIRPGSRPKPKAPKAPTCLIEEKWEKCEVTIDETGVSHPIGKITNVVQWTTDAKPFSTGGAIVGNSFNILVLMDNLYKHHNNELRLDHLVYVLAWFLQALLL